MTGAPFVYVAVPYAAWPTTTEPRSVCAAWRVFDGPREIGVIVRAVRRSRTNGVPFAAAVGSGSWYAVDPDRRVSTCDFHDRPAAARALRERAGIGTRTFEDLQFFTWPGGFPASRYEV